MNDNILFPGHHFSEERHDDWEAGYGGHDVAVSVPWLVCECGSEWRLSRHVGGDDHKRLLKLEHISNVLGSQICPNCSANNYPCPDHCAMRSSHTHLEGKFCQGCGQRFE